MKRAFLLLVSLIFVTSVYAQESGNRIYGNNGYYQQRRQPQTNTGNLASSGWGIEASVLTNLKPDAFVAVFGVSDEAIASADSNQKVDAKISALSEKIAPMGITRDDIFVDFITQNRVYDFTVSGSQANPSRC